MILITGGAGFVGSCLQAALMRRGHETVVVDTLGSDGKWRNLAKHPPARIVNPADLDTFLESHPPVEMVFHLGAVSETTAVDGDQTWATNVELSHRLWSWCADRSVRMVYASSGATYGDGSLGFDDDSSLAALQRLRPLNLYGWTKHAFDILVAKALLTKRDHPPQWAGLKFFNVYGPNEYHKGRMVSVVKVKYDEVVSGAPARLFRSDQAGLADGAQSRDFIWVGDVVDVMLWLMDTPSVSGLFNLGTGQARTYLDMAHAVSDAAGLPRAVQFIDMPAPLRGQYQSFTQASMNRLRTAGYNGQFTPLEEGVRRYVQDYLAGPDPFMIPVLLFPQFDPVIVQLGPLSIRWYALAYICSLVIGWRLVRRLVRLAPAVATDIQVDDFLTWATLGVVLGGRLGYVLFYQPSTYLAHPAMILAVWEGGMSFHGGMLGVAIAIIVFCRRNAIPVLGLADRIAIVAPIGLGLGRIANFINGELWGRQAPDWLPWAMAFPRAPDCPRFPDVCMPRHPSQLYEALLEGLVLFAVVFVLSRRDRVRERFGMLTGIFLCGYAVARIIGEYFREPDAFLGFLAFGTTMGQILSVPMFLAGLWLIVRARPATAAARDGRAGSRP